MTTGDRASKSSSPISTTPAECRVRFFPDAAEAWVSAGSTILMAAASAGVAIDAPCGDRGICGKCKVRILGGPVEEAGEMGKPAGTGLEPPTLPERTLISDEELADGWRLACQAKARGSVDVQVPERALKAAVVPLSRVELDPNVRKYHLLLPEATIEDPVSDLGRLRAVLAPRTGDFQVDLDRVRSIPDLLQRSHDLTAVLAGHHLIGLENGDTTGRCFGAAVDLGTTSVVVVLADLTTGEVLGVESRLNGQANFGADVISRIHRSAEPGGLEQLREAAAKTINSALSDLTARVGVNPHSVYEMAVVGNSCMNHLFLGINPMSLAVAPYQPVIADPMETPAAALGIAINPSGRVYTLPNVAGFVGSDTIAVVLATAMHRADELLLAIDLGTNGEMVLGNRRRLLACSTAAGPAFEGARISCGMRATEGAIERVWIDEGEVTLQVIGRGSPLGVCGSGLMDAVAQIRRASLVNESGRLAEPGGETPAIPPRLVERLVPADGNAGFLLGRRGRRAVVLSQRDIRELQLAKGAIRAGISILLKEYGARAEDISEVLLAGAFGSYISPASARTIGLVPSIPLDRITAVGNAAGQGAQMALLSRRMREEATAIARSIEYVELAARPDFMDQFMDAMLLDG